MGFFSKLSEITGVATPSTDSILVYLLYCFAGSWFLIPYLMKHKYSFGHYLVWTFFTAMGVNELAHFIFPFLMFTPAQPDPLYRSS